MFHLFKRTQAHSTIPNGKYIVTYYADRPPSMEAAARGLSVVSVDSDGYLIEETIIIRAIDHSRLTLVYVAWDNGNVETTESTFADVLSAFESVESVSRVI